MINLKIKRKYSAVLVVALILAAASFNFGQKNVDRELPANRMENSKADALFAEAVDLANQNTISSMRAALVKFEQALEVYKKTRDTELQAESFGWLGKLNNLINENPKAINHYNQASLLYKQVEDKNGEASTLYKIGSIYSSSGENQKAVNVYNQALPLFREIGNKKYEADTLTSLGLVYYPLGDNQKALEVCDQAVLIYKQIGDKSGEATAMTGIGLINFLSGEFQTALEYYQQILQLRRETGDKRSEGVILTGIGRAYTEIGEYQKALESHNQSILIYKQLGDKSGEAAALSDSGVIYYTLGEYQKALEVQNQALSFYKQSADKNREALALNGIGQVYQELNEQQKALNFYEQALSLFRQIGEKSGESIVLNNIGFVYNAMGEYQKAIGFYNQALSIKQPGGKGVEARILTNIGRAYSSTEEKQKALEYYKQALPIMKKSGDKTGEAKTLKHIMNFWEDQKVSRLAILYGKQSVNVYQGLRTNIKGLDKSIQKIYLQNIEDTYRTLADILVKKGRIAEAEQVLAMLKEEEYLSYLRRDDSVADDLKGKISLSPDEKKAFEDYEKFSAEITKTAAEFGTLEKKKNALPLGDSLSAEDQKQYDLLKAKYDAAITVFNKYLDDLKVKFSENDKRVAAVESDTQGLLKKLDQPRTVIISTIVGEDNLNLIVTTSDVQKAHTVNIKAAELNKLVAEFRDAVKNPAVDPRPLGKQLYDKLFPAALQKDLDNIKADTIVWSLDGTLRYVPMAALYDGEKYLAERYTNAVLTLASRDKLDGKADAERKNWLVFGVGVSKAYENFNALPAVPEELCSVVDDPKKKNFCGTFGADGVFKGLMLRDEEFTLTGFQNNLGKTAVVHIASHFSLNAGNETDSYLLLGGGETRRFSLDNLKKTRLDNIELLTLSACNTAMTSGANSSGVEVEGFGALAQKQGAKTVLATLWAVADDSTGELMSEFYKILETDPNTGKAEALRKAQLKMIGGEYKTSEESAKKRSDLINLSGENTNQPKFETDKNAPFAHPYFWSPFVLIGNWK